MANKTSNKKETKKKPSGSKDGEGERSISLKLGFIEVSLTGTKSDSMPTLVKLADDEMRDLSKLYVELSQKKGVVITNY